MADLSQDPIINAVHNGIKRGIRVMIEHECFGPGVILILSGIDSMAYLGMPEGQEDVTRTDFVNWAEKYIRFPCKEQLTGLDLYGARCAMLHSYSVTSGLSRQGKCRMVGYMDQSIPEVRFEPQVSANLVLVSAVALADAFYEGVDRFLIDVFNDQRRGRVVEERLRHLVHMLSATGRQDQAV
jgi:hypothetical protein